jgi:hypothetical protein
MAPHPGPLPAGRGEGDSMLLRRWMVVDPRGVQPGHFWDTVSRWAGRGSAALEIQDGIQVTGQAGRSSVGEIT